MLLTLTITSCAIAPIESYYDRTDFVASSHNSDLDSAETPDGFLISPSEAYKALELDMLQKFSWSIYADRKNYYLIQNSPLHFTTSSEARLYGRRVNGKTGKTDATMEQ